MKTQLNMTDTRCDLDRFWCRQDFVDLIDGFDGVELMCIEGDTRGIIPKERVIGLHMNCLPYWVDFWNGNEQALEEEFGSLDECERAYGGSDRSALINHYLRDISAALRYEAEYMVFHVSDVRIDESLTRQFRRSDASVIVATCELMDALLSFCPNMPAVFFENLWLPGLTFTDVSATRLLLDAFPDRRFGLMLDTGHIAHTCLELTTQEEALSYINKLLDEHGPICERIRGVHLNMSITSDYCKRMMASPPPLASTYGERMTQMFYHGFSCDRHMPFTCDGVDTLIKRISPDYLTFEFITNDSEQLKHYILQQRQALRI